MQKKARELIENDFALNKSNEHVELKFLSNISKTKVLKNNSFKKSKRLQNTGKTLQKQSMKSFNKENQKHFKQTRKHFKTT